MIDCKHYRPGDPGFNELAACITPLNRIRKGYSERRNDITADIAPMPRARRNETLDKQR